MLTSVFKEILEPLGFGLSALQHHLRDHGPSLAQFPLEICFNSRSGRHKRCKSPLLHSLLPSHIEKTPGALVEQAKHPRDPQHPSGCSQLQRGCGLRTWTTSHSGVLLLLMDALFYHYFPADRLQTGCARTNRSRKYAKNENV